MPIPLLAVAGALVKIAHSAYTWTQKTPQGRATLAAANAAAAYQHAKKHPTDGSAQQHAFEAGKKLGEHVVNPAAQSLYSHVRKDLNKP
ncbi:MULTISPECIES: hypothetical protein [Streptomyces]|uniref:Uncharacterized protein n=1 Tax=Streptomyces spororaveus TaxID=284039 RepID=A0ABQ3TIU2_9ACTN|nr:MULTISPECIES: hypothetical protein [Streptomyces]MCM9079349.1 hypothetical protein [Streptomyces spororaveus]MCX5306234.1 hypothetical protein [Streptomyces sp. NBC_00160]GHI80329.1 hypothetical protein Sspor_58900 [Streptomyces spororaveus]